MCEPTLSTATREQLRSMVNVLGTRGACAELGVSPATLARAIAGLPVLGVTASHLTSALAQSPTAPPAPGQEQSA